MDKEAEKGFFRRIFSKKIPFSHSVSDQNSEKLTRDELLRKAESFNTVTVADVMVPRADIIAIERFSSLYEIADTFKQAAHSRLPIYEETLDNPIGMVHIKDIISFLVLDHNQNKLSPEEKEGSFESKRRAQNIPDLEKTNLLDDVKRPLLYIPASMKALDLLMRMKVRRIHMALVVDEFGGTDGLVTLEDLVEQIVGDIEDEHDKNEAPKFHLIGKNLWFVKARVMVEEFEIQTGFSLKIAEDENIDTLGGIVAVLAGRVPERGEIILHPSGCEFEIIEADSRRIKSLHIHLPKTEEAFQPVSSSKQED